MLAREYGLTALLTALSDPQRSLGQLAPSPVLERTLPRLISGSFSTPVILREWDPRPIEVIMILLFFITLVINWGHAPYEQIDLRSGDGTYEGLVTSPLYLLCAARFMSAPVLDHSNGPLLSYVLEVGG